MIGVNGGLLGSQRSTSPTSGVGLWTPNEQVLLKRANVWPGEFDQWLGNVSALLHMDGSNGSTTFTDSSNYNNSVLRAGDTQIKTDQARFGGASAYFDGTGDYLQLPPSSTSDFFGFGSGDYTIELWFLVASHTSTNRTICAIGPNLNQSLTLNTSNVLSFAGGNIVGTTSPAANAWHHVALSRVSGSIRLFLNGAQQGSTWNSVSGGTSDFLYLGINSSASLPFTGWIDEVRVTKGVGRYTSNFTPPGSPFVSVGGSGDPLALATSLLLHMDGSNGSTTFTDSSINALSITAAGTATVSTAQSKFGGASAYFNGASDALTYTDPALSTGSFTIEMWIKTTTTVRYAQLVGNETASNTGYTLMLNYVGPSTGDIALFVNGGFVCATSGTSYLDDVWHHVAVTRNGTAITLWVDGASRATGTSSASFSGTTNYIGRNNIFTPRNYVGYIDDLRITKGVARYTSAFTPPTAAFPNP